MKNLQLTVFVFLVPALLSGCGTAKEELTKGIKAGIAETVPPEVKEEFKPVTDAAERAREKVGELGQEVGRKAGEALSGVAGKAAKTEQGKRAIEGTAEALDSIPGAAKPDQVRPPVVDPIIRAEEAAIRAERAAAKLEEALKQVERCCPR